jgi:hypothetical protein
MWCLSTEATHKMVKNGSACQNSHISDVLYCPGLCGVGSACLWRLVFFITKCQSCPRLRGAESACLSCCFLFHHAPTVKQKQLPRASKDLTGRFSISAWSWSCRAVRQSWLVAGRGLRIVGRVQHFTLCGKHLPGIQIREFRQSMLCRRLWAARQLCGGRSVAGIWSGALPAPTLTIVVECPRTLMGQKHAHMIKWQWMGDPVK